MPAHMRGRRSPASLSGQRRARMAGERDSHSPKAGQVKKKKESARLDFWQEGGREGVSLLGGVTYAHVCLCQLTENDGDQKSKKQKTTKKCAFCAKMAQMSAQVCVCLCVCVVSRNYEQL